MFTSVLMIEKPLTSADVEFVTTLHGDERVSFVVLHAAPGRPGRPAAARHRRRRPRRAGRGGREGESRRARRRTAPAERALKHSLQALRAAGSQAEGQLVEDHPLDKLKSVVDEVGADEVIVLTDPHYVEEFFHRDWASRARHKVGVPVLKLFAHSELREARRVLRPSGAGRARAGARRRSRSPAPLGAVRPAVRAIA